MTSTLQDFRDECRRVLSDAISKAFPEWAKKPIKFTTPPRMELGELSSSVAHEIAREKNVPPSPVAEQICAVIQVNEGSIIGRVESVSGYVNFHLHYDVASKLILGSALGEDEAYGIERIAMPSRISLEHTSANPSGPLTMGHCRNAILGDSIARLLMARGHSIKRRFYVDDVGRQISILAFGYRLLDRPKPEGKPDHWLGTLYSCTNCAVEIQTLKKRLNQLSDDGQRSLLIQQLDDWVAVAAELEKIDRDLFSRVVEAVAAQEDPQGAIQEISMKYERGDPETVSLVKELVSLCLTGIETSLNQIGITFDVWDWESRILWDGHVQAVIDQLRRLPFIQEVGASLVLNVNSIVDSYGLREKFQLSSNYDVPSLTLTRSDGTSLYATRDIAYTLLKFQESDRVINVIGSEQTLPQLQIRLALYAMGYGRFAEEMVHFAHGLVELPGARMSKRRARYITMDEVMEQSFRRVAEIVEKRKAELRDEMQEIIKKIALASIRFAMVNVSGSKNLMFTWDRVLSLERNSAPFVNYAYTRAGSILRKLGEIKEAVEFSALKHPLEQLLIFRVGQLPEVFSYAADQLKPEDLAGYANSLAEKFHEYYEKVDVIHSEPAVRNARGLLVKSVRIALRNSISVLGIELTERM